MPADKGLQQTLHEGEPPHMCPNCRCDPERRVRWDATYLCGTEWIGSTNEVPPALRITNACGIIRGLRSQLHDCNAAFVSVTGGR